MKHHGLQKSFGQESAFWAEIRRYYFRGLAFSLIAGFFSPLGIGNVYSAETYYSHKLYLDTYYSRAKYKDSEVARLIEEKQKTKDSETAKALIQEISKNYEEAQDNYKKYLKERDILRFQFPEHGEEIERKYRPFRIHSEEDLEAELGIDWKLNVVKVKLQNIYNTTPVTTTLAAEETTTTSTTQPRPKPLITPPPEKPRPKLKM